MTENRSGCEGGWEARLQGTRQCSIGKKVEIQGSLLSYKPITLSNQKSRVVLDIQHANTLLQQQRKLLALWEGKKKQRGKLDYMRSVHYEKIWKDPVKKSWELSSLDFSPVTWGSQKVQLSIYSYLKFVQWPGTETHIILALWRSRQEERASWECTSLNWISEYKLHFKTLSKI